VQVARGAHICRKLHDALQFRGFWGVDTLVDRRGRVLLIDLNVGRPNGGHAPKLFMQLRAPNAGGFCFVKCHMPSSMSVLEATEAAREAGLLFGSCSAVAAPEAAEAVVAPEAAAVVGDAGSRVAAGEKKRSSGRAGDSATIASQSTKAAAMPEASVAGGSAVSVGVRAKSAPAVADKDQRGVALIHVSPGGKSHVVVVGSTPEDTTAIRAAWDKWLVEMEAATAVVA